MSRSIFTAPQFNDEAAAYAYIEARLWASGRVCPHCGVVGQSGALQGKTNRIGLYKCYACRKPFTVKVGTIFEDSHIAMRDWLAAIHLVCSSKKGISANQLHRTLGITLKSAWFLGHRIREAMNGDMAANPMGGDGEILEIDEAYIGGLEKNKHANKRIPGNMGGKGKAPVFALVERGGTIRAFHVPNVTGKNLATIVQRNVAPGTTIYSDSDHTTRYAAFAYKRDKVDHRSGEYVRGVVHTNTVEGFFSILKRGVTGVYHSVSEAHLQRYLAEFGFRYSNRKALGVDDVERADRALVGAKGKRLTYATPRQGRPRAASPI
ncbi:MAG: IS1595 family transposase [Stellaceae bacterium]